LWYGGVSDVVRYGPPHVCRGFAEDLLKVRPLRPGATLNFVIVDTTQTAQFWAARVMIASARAGAHWPAICAASPGKSELHSVMRRLTRSDSPVWVSVDRLWRQAAIHVERHG
jgi:hypothetical protein